MGKRTMKRRLPLRFVAIVTSMAIEPAPRPLRRDAERNRVRLLEAARSLFAERGLDVTMDDIARHAGVGVGTAYRRFSGRDELIEALFAQRMEEFVALAERALDLDDPWTALAGFLEDLVAMQAADRGLKQVMLSQAPHCARLGRERTLPIVEELVRRAREAGALRADIGAADVGMASMMLGAVAEFAHEVEPGLWRRYLPIVLDGLRARPDTEPLPTAPLTPAQLDRALTRRR